MIAGVSWADVVIVAVIALGTFRGFRRGFIRELAGMIAMAAGVIAPWYYNGVLDQPIAQAAKLALPFAHLAGLAITGIGAYAIVLAIGAVLQRAAKLPVLGTGNALAGAIVGFLKAAVVLWLILFFALFFPLTPPIRASLHASKLAPYFVAADQPIDAALQASIPSFVRPFVAPLLERHHL